MIRINSQPFNSSNKRKLGEPSNINPGPGDYNTSKDLGKKNNEKELKINGKNSTLLN